MGRLNRLLVVSERYPVPGEPVFPFVDELLVKLDALGVEIQVISPRSTTRRLVRGGGNVPCVWRRETARGGFLVRQPRYLSAGTLLPGLTRRMYQHAVAREIAAMDFVPDACYTHFWYSGVAAARALPHGPKVFVACGESQLRPGCAEDVKRLQDRFGGVISVSGKNKDDCVRMYGISPEMIEVMPNGVDEALFHPPAAARREEKRAELGIAPEQFVVAFVGWFSERKGVRRVESALEGLENVRALYIGSGDLTPRAGNIAFCGRVEHDQLPGLLGAADAFVLPTRAEGCCNAIVEAMACGLPVISSLGAFNDDLLHGDDAIRVDPDDVPAIREAVLCLRDNPQMRRAMGERAAAFARSLSIARRAERIRGFIEARIK